MVWFGTPQSKLVTSILPVLPNDKTFGSHENCKMNVKVKTEMSSTKSGKFDSDFREGLLRVRSFSSNNVLDFSGIGMRGWTKEGCISNMLLIDMREEIFAFLSPTNLTSYIVNRVDNLQWKYAI